MNKKEKFYKNLSEFNIQKPKLEKVEFKDIKTLDKLEKTASSLQKKVFETYKRQFSIYVIAWNGLFNSIIFKNNFISFN